VGLKNRVLDGVEIPHGKGQFLGLSGPLLESVLHQFMQQRLITATVEAGLHAASCIAPDWLVSYSYYVVSPVKSRWHNGWSVGLAISRSWVQICSGQKLRNNLGQVVHAYMPLSPSSITWYQSRGSDALQLTYSHLEADCLYTGISFMANTQYLVWEAFSFTCEKANLCNVDFCQNSLTTC